MDDKPLVPVAARLHPDVLARLDEIAKRERRSRSAMIAIMIEGSIMQEDMVNDG